MTNRAKTPPNAGKGRPKGARNKVTAPIKALAARYTEEALRVLAEIMLDAGDETTEGAPPAARVAAAKELLDRAHGKAPQAHTGDDDAAPIRHVHEIIRRVVDPGNSDA